VILSGLAYDARNTVLKIVVRMDRGKRERGALKGDLIRGRTVSMVLRKSRPMVVRFIMSWGL